MNHVYLLNMWCTLFYENLSWRITFFFLQRAALIGINSILFLPSGPSCPMCIFGYVSFIRFSDVSAMFSAMEANKRSVRSFFAMRCRNTDQGGIIIAIYVQSKSTVICSSVFSLGHLICKRVAWKTYCKWAYLTFVKISKLCQRRFFFSFYVFIEISSDCRGIRSSSSGEK